MQVPACYACSSVGHAAHVPHGCQQAKHATPLAILLLHRTPMPYFESPHELESTHRPPFGNRGARVAGSLFVPRVSCRHPRFVSYRLKWEPQVPSPVSRIWQRPLPFIFPRKSSLSRYLPRVFYVRATPLPLPDLILTQSGPFGC